MTSGEEQDPVLERVLEALAEPGRGLSAAQAHELVEAYQRQKARVTRLARVSDLFHGQAMSRVASLADAVAAAKVIKGIIPICASCKKIRNSGGEWQQLEEYIIENSDALFSHGFCPPCENKYGALHDERRTGTGASSTGETVAVGDEDLDDPTVLRFLPVVNDPHFAKAALRDDLLLLFQRYLRLTRRLRRIARISDGYQAELQEAKSALERSSRTDPLTGIPNRLDLLERFRGELGRARRHDRPLAVLMIDLDGFKDVNDRYGHRAGDELLVAVAHALRENLRSQDLLARWGGEEFVLVLPETDAEHAGKVAEKLRLLVAGLEVAVEAASISVTASLGVVTCLGTDDPDVAIRRADGALYDAKAAGRNRCVVRL